MLRSIPHAGAAAVFLPGRGRWRRGNLHQIEQTIPYLVDVSQY